MGPPMGLTPRVMLPQVQPMGLTPRVMLQQHPLDPSSHATTGPPMGLTPSHATTGPPMGLTPRAMLPGPPMGLTLESCTTGPPMPDPSSHATTGPPMGLTESCYHRSTHGPDPRVMLPQVHPWPDPRAMLPQSTTHGLTQVSMSRDQPIKLPWSLLRRTRLVNGSWSACGRARGPETFTREVMALYVSAIVEVGVAAVVTLLVTEPYGSFNIRSYSMVFVFYTLCLMVMLLVRPILSSKLLPGRGKAAIYSALYFLPALIVTHAVGAGLIYYSFPYMVIILSIISNAAHFAFQLDQSITCPLMECHGSEKPGHLARPLGTPCLRILAITQLRGSSTWLPLCPGASAALYILTPHSPILQILAEWDLGGGEGSAGFGRQPRG
ncbi:JNK1/MAPK8-associated membrane protein-like, partial [Homarus americanus]